MPAIVKTQYCTSYAYLGSADPTALCVEESTDKAGNLLQRLPRCPDSFAENDSATTGVLGPGTLHPNPMHADL